MSDKAKSKKNTKKVVLPSQVIRQKRTTSEGNYVTKEELLAELKASKAQGKMTVKFQKQLFMMCTKYANTPRFARYPCLDDMIAYAMMNLVTSWYKFDENVYDNAFSFYTQCFKNSFFQYLMRYEYKHLKVVNTLMIEHGLNPSDNYQLDHKGYEDGDSDYSYDVNHVFGGDIDAIDLINGDGNDYGTFEIEDEANMELSNSLVDHSLFDVLSDGDLLSELESDPDFIDTSDEDN